jgi:hypothetical protein
MSKKHLNPRCSWLCPIVASIGIEMKAIGVALFVSFPIAIGLVVQSGALHSPKERNAESASRHDTPTGGEKVDASASGQPELGVTPTPDVAPTSNESRLLDNSGSNAVFVIDGALEHVRAGEQLPGSEATLRHLTPDGVVVEFAADSEGPGVLLSIKRGQTIRRPASDKIVPRSQPQLQISGIQVVKSTEATSTAVERRRRR